MLIFNQIRTHTHIWVCVHAQEDLKKSVINKIFKGKLLGDEEE